MSVDVCNTLDKDDKALVLYKELYHPDLPIDRRRRAGWIVSFTDLMAILLSFFVLLFSMMSPSQNEWGMIAGSFEEEFKKLERQLKGYAGTDSATNIDLSSKNEGENLDYIQTVLEGLLTRLPLDVAKDIKISRQRDRIVIFAPALLSFEQESAVLPDKARQTIMRFGKILKSFSNQIEIVGQVSSRENSHELAIKRAIAVANEFKRNGFRGNPTVLAMGLQGAPSYAQIYPDLDVVQQRVDIIILKEQAP
jgi:chemotaxis protein MotB